MDISNIQALISRGRLVSISQLDPTETYVQIGVFQPGNRQNGSGNPDTYPSFVIPLSEIGKVPSLQQVLDFNHDLQNGKNYQGTQAGQGNTGQNVNAFGKGAALNNQGDNLNAIGITAGEGNSGLSINAIGEITAKGNTGNYVNAMGALAALANSGSEVIAIGSAAANMNQGNNVIALGTNAGFDPIGSLPNTISQAFIVANTELPSYIDHTAAFAAIAGIGAAGNTYLYHNQTTNSIGAVRIP